MAVWRDYVYGQNPAVVPSTWQQTDPVQSPSSQVSLVGYSCQRVGLNGTERPAALVLEWSNNVLFPSACAEGAGGRFGLFLHRAWTNDTMVAMQLRTLGWSVIETEVSLGADTVGPLRTDWWTFTDASLTFYSDGRQDSGSRVGERLAWVSNGTASYMDLDYAGTSPPVQIQVVQGRVPSESSISSDGSEFQGAGVIYDELQATGVISRFASLDCSS